MISASFTAWLKIKPQGIMAVLLNASDEIRSLLDLMKLHTVLEIIDEEMTEPDGCP